ncbi:NTE family protein [Filomicrobium insigne]|uniref:NTE family protein n=1 Tax=Filomicrobium insigne TaxID=418854 RepID=A0A1H0N255_9HYPH|nr:patatin-like phospholipase family protein [Filomicrobium insigne]SDO86784.1 NTE family protein [Filomicrobium insigne]
MQRRDMQSLFEAGHATGDFLTASKVEDSIGLCLSGGGYRAMLYHLGALTYLNEMGLLSQLAEIASVSGGSIAAGVLAHGWPRLEFRGDGVASNFEEEVATPLARFAQVNVDIRAALLGFLPGRTAADGVAEVYDRHLFHGVTLQDLPDRPRFTFMATNLQTGSAWRFAKDYAADFRIGRIVRPTFALAKVVAASSAFPPFLSPARFSFAGHVVEPMDGADLHRPPFTEGVVLTDGGVYDNLGLERIWKRCRKILVSNGGKTVPEIGRPTGRWIGQAYRTLNIVLQQAEHSRRRILFGMGNLEQRDVVYWSIDTPNSYYGLVRANDLGDEGNRCAAAIATRLARLPNEHIALLQRAGYENCRAALQARGDGSDRRLRLGKIA